MSALNFVNCGSRQGETAYVQPRLELWRVGGERGYPEENLGKNHIEWGP